MKKVIVFLLLAAMMCSLCACGKSKEAEAVEGLIAEIGKVSTDSRGKIEEAESAYNALSDKDKQAVENYSILEDAKSTLENIEYCDLVSLIKEMNENSDMITSQIYDIWDFVGVDLVGYALTCIRGITDEAPLEAYKLSQNGESSDWDDYWYTVVGVVKYTLYEDDRLYEDFNEETIADTVSTCIAFNVICEAIDIENTALANDIKAFKKSCSDKYTEAMDNMDEWYLESSLYAEFALNESGSLTSYRTQKDEYDVKIKRYQKIAESYE